MAESRDTELVLKRLDAIISVLLETSRPAGKEIQMSERIRILYNAGLRPIEIARILGISATNVNVRLNELRRGKPKRKGD